MSHQQLPAFDTPTNIDGEITSIDIMGHLTDPEVEAFLWEIERDPELVNPYDGSSFCFSVEHLYRYTRPPEEEDYDPDGQFDYLFEYSPDPVPGGTPVTRLNTDSWGWDSPNCAYHPYEPSTSGLPAYLWPENSSHLVTTNNPGTPHETQYIYVCHKCSARIANQERTQTNLRVKEVERRRTAGVPESLVYE